MMLLRAVAICSLALCSATSLPATEKTYVKGKLVDIGSLKTKTPIQVQNNGAAPLIVSAENEEYTISVQLGDLIYTGRYQVKVYKPEGWTVNDSVDVRFEGDKMFIRRPDKPEKEIKMKIFKKVRVATPPEA